MFKFDGLNYNLNFRNRILNRSDATKADIADIFALRMQCVVGKRAHGSGQNNLRMDTR